MQRESSRRGFSIVNQKVVLELDFSGAARGYTDITLVPTSAALRTILLHCRQCEIETITVASYKAEFLHHDPIASLNLVNPSDFHSYPEYKRKLFSALAECDDGELAIAVPPQVSLKQADVSAIGVIHSEVGTPEPSTPGPSTHPLPATEFSPIVVHIEYSLRRPADGLQFVLPTEADPYRVPHVFTNPSSPDAARCWVPCIDNPWEKCTWDFEFVVPRYLEEHDQDAARSYRDDEPGEDSELGDWPTVVVCSGELIEQVSHPYNSTKTIFLFTLSAFTSAQHVGFAAGPFHILNLPLDSSHHAEGSSSQPQMHVFCLPGSEHMLIASTTFLRSAMTFYTDFGQYPFSSYKVIFVDEMSTARFDCATMTIVSADLLHGDDAIDQVFETRQVLAHGLACQWAGIYIQPKAYSDTWLVAGIGLYICGLFLRKLLGNNEYRFRLKQDMERVIARDVGTKPPICQPGVLEPPDTANLSFIHLKAPLVLHILDRRLGKSGTSLGLSRVLPKIFLAALSGEMPNNFLSTHFFLRTCRKISGVDLRSFADQWIYGSGCPRFSFSATFNRKRMAVELTMRQDAPAYTHNEHDPVALALLKPIPFFEGQMTIRIHEADGTPYEHVLDVRTPSKRYEVPFNTKYKRVRRNTKRFLARQAAAAAAAQGDTEAAEAIGMIDMGFGLEVWEDIKERENWKVADWTEEDEQNMSGAVYEWIRMDADFEWIGSINFEQPDYMWVSQLQRDRDVVAQLEAVRALSRQSSHIVSSTLTKTVLVTNYFFRIRVEAALALVNCATRRLDFIGLFHLFKMFLRYCYNPDDPTKELFTLKYVPRPNDFSDLAEYFVRRAIVSAISQVRIEKGKSPPIVRQFLIDQLRYNDNTNNPFGDALYISSLISALATAVVPNVPPERGELVSDETRTEQSAEDRELLAAAVAEVDRYRSMDRLVPSTHNIVTIAALEFNLIVSMANLIPNDSKPFLACSREGNYTQVRIVAFDGLLLSNWFTPKIMKYLFTVMSYDSSRIIRRHIARGMCESLAIQYSIGEIKSALSKDGESLLIEEDGNGGEKSKEARKTDPELMFRSLRRDREIGKNDVIRECLVPLLLSPNLDYQVRWCLLKLAEMTIRPAEEALPKVTIHLPPTPVSEAPPILPAPIPKVRVAPKLPIKPPATPLATSAAKASPAFPKIKLGSSINAPKAQAPPQAQIKTELPKRHAGLDRPSQNPDKKKKDKILPKGQSGGLSNRDLRACRTALKKLMAYSHSILFRQPVDPIRDRAPNYFDVIKNPMDLSTMNAKLEAGLYNSLAQFEADFRLMIENAKTYNPAGAFAYNEALALDSFFNKAWARIRNTLEHAGNLTRPPAVMDEVESAIVSTLDIVREPVAPTPIRPEPAEHAPKIKLKLGAQKNAPPRVPSASPLPSALPPKASSSTAKETVDDILLQEVIEMEQDRPRSEKKKEKLKFKEKEKDKGGPPPLAANILLPPSKSEVLPSMKVKKPTISLPGSGSSSAPSIKIKNPERTPIPQASQPTTSSAKPTPAAPIPINEKKCREILRILRKLPEAIIFNRPVDPERDGCPTYYDEIKHPMDFETLSNNLDSGRYSTMEAFAHDVELIFSNCRLFNPPTTPPTEWASAVERVWKKEWNKALEKRLGGHEKRALQGLLTRLMKMDTLVFFFKDPVDPIALNIPDYHKVIPKKDARDLRTIRTKLDNDKYDSIQAFESDVQLMVRNAVTFNGAESLVGQTATQLQKKVKEMLEEVKVTQGKKRKDEEKVSGSNKKMKI
ncbi:hypothetical protein SISNIDRAFT_441399 [Sistotremastrum niveocremeum HHB9708]|uniref:Transcription initiation factor TFIID subunit 2 n=1 Tax=Sistotremastrum niveocremeum HHB9708 TaxID=1314777 RepID=A0A164UTW8_9AGAM|nr:hypothetical protein SISNIDRAFT_441399 [Sistotremastrum niveocremeum HHB9708]